MLIQMKKSIQENRIIEIKTPDSIFFGVGAAKKLPNQIKILSPGPVLIVTDPGLVKAGIVDKIKKCIATESLDVHVFDAVDPDPDKENCYSCLAMAKSIGANILVGLGGGSAIDVAKATAVLAVNQGQIEDYVGIDKIPTKGLPTILLPTTAGTGSEVSPIAVISDKKQHLKLGMVSPFLYGDVAIIDPELTLSCPASITAASGLDALTHAIEIVTNKFSSPVIDGIMYEAIRLAGQHLRTCVHEGSNLSARTGMAMAAFYAGMGLGPVNTAAVHALAYPLGGTFDISHGMANSILLPYVMEYNLSACREKYAKIADCLSQDNKTHSTSQASAAVDLIKTLSQDIGIPQRLRDINIPEEAIDTMSKTAATVTRLLHNNPREMTVKDINTIYRSAY